MNENSSKQVLLSVLGIAVLVIAVVGVSFAFFTYSKTGTVTNTISTGEIFFNFDEGTAVTITNAMPTTDTIGAAQTAPYAAPSTGDEDVAVNTFSITGRNMSAKDIDYTITLVRGEAASGKALFANSEISFTITDLTTSTVAGTRNILLANGLSNDAVEKATTMATLLGSNSSASIITGSIPANTASNITHTYRLNMWINETATVSDTDSTKAYCSSGDNEETLRTDCSGSDVANDTRNPINKMYYSVTLNASSNTHTS